jgi:predicted acyl esterase
MDPSIDKSLVESGYAVFGVNTRSTGCSEGDSFDFLRPLYGLDGYDAIEFAAVQPWSNGSVGMYNWSWAGMSQLWTASFRPPHLKAIAPGMVIADPRGDSYAPGGVPQPWMISGWHQFLRDRWVGVRESAVEEHDAECLAQRERNLRAESLNSTARTVLQHPVRDAWLDERTVAQRTHLIAVPVLSMTAYQDGATTSRGGYFQETINPDQLWMIDTNGDHEIYASEAYRPMLIAFFDHFLKRKQNDWESQPRLRIWQEATTSRPEDPFVMGRQEGAAPSWVVNRASTKPEVRVVIFNLNGVGNMAQNRPSSGDPESFAYPVPGASVNLPEDSWGPLPKDWKTGSLAFTSLPLDKDIVTFGSASADLWLASAIAPDADVQVTLTNVRPDGKEMYVQRGWLRLSNRALDVARSTISRPILVDRPDAVLPLAPREAVLARVEINRFSFAFRKGSRIRLWIDTPSNTGFYSFSYNPVPTRLTLFHDASHPSRLVLSELPDVSPPPSSQRCGTILAQPCRQDPLTLAS